jgi:hypothetical protein
MYRALSPPGPTRQICGERGAVKGRRPVPEAKRRVDGASESHTIPAVAPGETATRIERKAAGPSTGRSEERGVSRGGVVVAVVVWRLFRAR